MTAKGGDTMKSIKIVRIIFFVLLAAAVILVGIAMYFKIFSKKHILDGPGMINTREGELMGVSYSYGGGMEGSSLYYSIKYGENTAFFEYEYCPANGAQTETASKEISLTYFDDFRRICRDTKCLLDVHYGKPVEVQILDAPVAIITFTLENGEMPTFRGDYEYPPNCNGLFAAVTTLFEEIKNMD